MSNHHPKSAQLDSVLITEELSRRPAREPNWQAENQVMRSLARQLIHDPDVMLQSLVDFAVELCDTSNATAGVSLVATNADGEKIFRWVALSGTLADQVGDCTPHNFSPCGVCLEQGTPVLFSHPERYFTYFQEAKVPFVEGLVLPLIAEGQALGTIWIITHDEGRQFDGEDVRLMTGLADFTAAALLQNQQQTQELLTVNAHLETEAIKHRLAEERALAIIENLPGGAVFIVDRDLRYQLAEGEALSTAGFTAERLVGRTIFEVLSPELAASYEPNYRQALAGEPFEIEHQSHDRWYVSRGTPLYDDKSEVYAVLVISYDITDRKRAEEQSRYVAARDAFRIKLSDELRSLGDAVEIEATVTQVALHHFGADRCYYCEIEDGNAVIRRDAARDGLPTVAGVYPLSSFAILQAVIEAGHPFVVQDVRTTDTVGDDLRQLCIQLQVISYIDVPVIKNGQPVGVLCLVQSTPRDWTDLEVELAIETADRTWAAVERARAEALLRASEAKYRTLFDSMDEGVSTLEVIFDETERAVDFIYLENNQALTRLTGLTSDITGKRVSEVIPNLEAFWLELYERVVQTGTPERAEHFIAVLDRWFDVFVARVGRADNHTVVVLYNDITNRKRAEEQQAFLLKFSDALRAEPDADSIGSRAVRMLAEHLHLDRCWLAEVFEQQDIAKIGWEYHRPDLPPTAGVYRLSDYPEIMRQIATQPMVIHDIASDPDFADSEKALLAQLQIQALLVVSLRKGQHQVIWALVCTVTAARHWNESERVLLEQVSERTWAAIERARAEAALREAELQRFREQSAREQERARAEALTGLDRAKTIFFSNISHEFRTPLTLLLGPLEDAIKSVDESISRSVDESPSTHPPIHLSTLPQLHLAHRNAQRLLKLVNTLLDFSRVEADRIQANYEPTELAAYTADLASIFRSTVENAGLRFIVDCPPLSESVYIDREMWEKIVLNLLSNAFKFTFEGEIAVRLQESVEFSKFVTLEVRDTGVGIPDDELPHIFERFYQSKSNQGRSHEGSGIGLSLVQELVKLHSGTIKVTSDVGRGTTFTVTVPMGTEHLPADARSPSRRRGRTYFSTPVLNEPSAPTIPTSADAFVEEAQSWLPDDSGFQTVGSAPEISPGDPISHYSKSKILLIEDNADMRRYLKRLLDPYYAVKTADNGAAALAIIRDALELKEEGDNGPVYDLVLTDIMMPEVDGFELLRSLRENSHTREIPIILLSARAGEESQIEGLDAGADDYLVKPFSARELLARVDANLKLAQMRREAVYREQVMREVQALNDTLEQRVQVRTAQLEAINQELEAFSYSVSHDLQTPLRYISRFVEQLQTKLNAESVDASSLRYLGIIEQAASQAHRMVNDLLEFSRMGNMRLRLLQVSMNQLVQQVRSQFEPEITDRTIFWYVEPLPEVRGDPNLLRLVLQNLLSNAVKYTRDRPTATIKIGSYTNNSEIVFFIQDNGAGFDMRYQNRLFSLFQRLHSQEKFAGTGVGLANVRRIIHRHGGRVWAEGAVDQGATFYFSLPKQEILI